jgi:predicted nucleic acid-binding protein
VAYLLDTNVAIHLLDRMIAVQALVHLAALVTLIASDFTDVAGLQVVAW